MAYGRHNAESLKVILCYVNFSGQPGCGIMQPGTSISDILCVEGEPALCGRKREGLRRLPTECMQNSDGVHRAKGKRSSLHIVIIRSQSFLA